MAIRNSPFSKMGELLQAATAAQQAIGQTVITMSRDDEGHWVCAGDWRAKTLWTARVALPDASLHDAKWTSKLIQPYIHF